MQISLLMRHVKVGGGNRIYLEMANRLIKKNHQVVIYHPTGEPCDWMECLADIKPISEATKIKHQVLMRSWAGKSEYDIAKKITADLKIYYVLHLYENYLMTGFHPSLYWRNEKTLYTKKSIQKADVVLACSTWQSDWIRNNLGVNSEPLLIGVNKEMFYPAPVKKNATKIRIIHTGASKGWKNTNFVDKALNIIKAKYPNVETDYFYDKNIPQDKMAEFYSSGDIFIDAQIYGGWNLPVSEAMACGVPVVCSDIGSIKDFAFEGKTALLFKLGDLQACVSQLEKLINNPQLRAELSTNALERINQFTWDDCVVKFEKIVNANLTKNHAAKN